MSWHAESALLMIANENCQLQCYDVSLSCLRIQVLEEELASFGIADFSVYFTNKPLLFRACFNNNHIERYSGQNRRDSFMLLVFEKGPLAIIRFFGGQKHEDDILTSGFTTDVLMQQYLKKNNVERAINTLLCLDWDIHGQKNLSNLQKIANYILKQPLQQERENQMQKALGSFLVPVKPLCNDTKKKFEDQIRDIARKFFQYLIRFKSYETAFNLAIDIDDEDVFMDLHNCAKEDDLFGLSKDAFHKAQEISDAHKSSKYLYR